MDGWPIIKGAKPKECLRVKWMNHVHDMFLQRRRISNPAQILMQSQKSSPY